MKITEHIVNIRKHLIENNLDAMLIVNEYNRRYATGFPSTAGELLVTRESAWFFTDMRYFEAAEKKISSAKVCLLERYDGYLSDLNDLLTEAKIAKLGFEQKTLTVDRYERYKKALKTELVPAQYITEKARRVKDEEELSIMKKAQGVAEKAFTQLLGRISMDMTERELAGELFQLMIQNGAEDKSFDIIAVSGENSSVPHGEPGDEKLRQGFLTIDFGVKVDGYCSDCTRTICFGKPSEEMRTVYDTVLNAQLAGIGAARAGVTGQELDGAARNVIKEAGYGKYFGHAFGHSLGLEIHEAPSASPGNQEPIPKGTVISAEPGIYIPGKFGVRIEDVLYITEDGCENLTNLQKELLIL